MKHRVLWTGGWDSTYRVLDLVINKKRNIQPYYVLDERRKSTNMEIKTMEIIKEMIKYIDETASNRILETIYVNRDQIKENNNITNSYKLLNPISFGESI